MSYESLLDQIISGSTGTGPEIVSEQHDLNQINVEGWESDIPGTWDAAEYGITRDEAIKRWKEATTPEQREKFLAECRQRAINRASLDTSNGRVNVMVAGKPAWHQLGVNVREAVDSLHARQLSGTAYKILRIPHQYTWNGELRTSNDSYCLVRDDTGAKVGQCGKDYRVIQNDDGYKCLDNLLNEFGAKYVTAGSLYGGKQAWMQCELPQQAFAVNGSDEVIPYVIFTLDHTGSAKDYAYPTAERVVCANTYRVSRGDRDKGIGLRHTGDIQDKLERTRQALADSVLGFERFHEASEEMTRTPLEIEPYANDVLDACLEMTAARAAKGADALAAALQATEAQQELARKRFDRQINARKNLLDEILNRYEGERCGINGMRGTAWAGFNAVTETADYAKLGRESQDRETRLSRRFESNLNGLSDELKQAAYSLATN